MLFYVGMQPFCFRYHEFDNRLVVYFRSCILLFLFRSNAPNVLGKKKDRSSNITQTYTTTRIVNFFPTYLSSKTFRFSDVATVCCAAAAPPRLALFGGVVWLLVDS